MAQAPSAVSVDAVSKRFRLFKEHNQSVKQALIRRRRAVYDEFWALRDVSLEIPQGSTYALIGENGSGKSTLLKCMARILRPDKGSIETRGKVSALLELGAGFHPELSGRDNVFLNGAILGLRGKELRQRFDEIVAFAGLEEFIDSPVKIYSSGMYVRLGFSVAINVDPEVLLVDEVLAVGDEDFQQRCNDKFAQMRREGKTIVVVSHAMGLVRNLADQVAWLEHGVIKDQGAADHVIEGYLRKVHGARQDDATVSWREGSQEAVIDRIELLDGAGQPTRSFRTGDPMTVRIWYGAAEPVSHPVFGVAIHNLNGIHVTGPNARNTNVDIERLFGQGYVDLRVPRLLLVPGTYDMSASITDHGQLHVFDRRHRDIRFDVEAGHPADHEGLVTLAGEWSVGAMANEATA